MSFLTRKILKNVSTFVMNEYRFYVDFKGNLYFEDSKEYIYPNSIKDKKFITQFYQHLAPTKTFQESKKLGFKKDPQSIDKAKKLQEQIMRNKDCPYVAEFWGEHNYLKYAISPIIFTRIIPKTIVPEIQLGEEFKDAELLEFSFSQYSLFDINQISIDQQGKLWHPYLRIPKPKSKKISHSHDQVKVLSNSNILGVFSNQLIAQMLDQVTYENGSAYLSFKGNKININPKTQNLNQ